MLTDILSLADAPPLWEGAQCREADPADFDDEDTLAIPRGKGICAGCDFATVCAQWAVDHRETWGTWGGLTTAERAELLTPTMAAPAKRRHPVSRGRQPKRLINHGPCGECGKPIRSEERAQRYCSRSCGSKARERSKRGAA